MMFKKQSLLLLLALNSIGAFLVPPPITFIPAVEKCSDRCVGNFASLGKKLHSERFSTAISETEGETSDPTAKDDAADVVSDIAEKVETVEEIAEATASEDVTTEEEKPEAKTAEEDAFTAYVVNLSYDTTNNELRQIFSEYGKVTKVYMPFDKATGRARGFAFVGMSTKEELDKVVEEINEMEIDGRTIYVNEATPRGQKKEKKEEVEKTKMYIGNLSFDAEKEDLIEFFSEYGTVMDVYVPYDQVTGNPRGFAFVTMPAEDADVAIENADRADFMGRSIAVSKSLPRGQKAPKKEIRNEVKLYVGNISFDSEEESIRSLFEGYGTIFDVYLPMDRYTGMSRGFAFVTMSPEDAARAIEETDGYEMDGRILRVNEAQPKGYSNQNNNSYSDDDEWYSDDGEEAANE